MHRVSAALAFDELEATPGETREAFLRRMIAHEQELIDAFRWYGIVINTSMLAGRPCEASCRRGGQHAQQLVQVVWQLNGGDVFLSPMRRFEKLAGGKQPIVQGVGRQEDGRLRLVFECGSTPLLVAPPRGWDGKDPTVQRASVEWGRLSQQLVVWCTPGSARSS